MSMMMVSMMAGGLGVPNSCPPVVARPVLHLTNLAQNTEASPPCPATVAHWEEAAPEPGLYYLACLPRPRGMS